VPKRSKEQIVSQILDICCDGANKTTIVHRTNSNSTNVNLYLKMLIKNKLVKASDRSYRTTSKGIAILENLRRIHVALTDPEARPTDLRYNTVEQNYAN